MPTDVDEIKLFLEKKILATIAKEIRAANMSANRTQDMSKRVLSDLHNAASLSEIHLALPKLVKDYPELSSVLNPTIKEYNLKVKSAIDQRVSELLEEGHSDMVHEVAKKIL